MFNINIVGGLYCNTLEKVLLIVYLLMCYAKVSLLKLTPKLSIYFLVISLSTLFLALLFTSG